MTNRKVLQPQMDRCRESLVTSLRMPGDNSQLVAGRTRKLLRWKPPTAELEAWLREMLPEGWYYDKAMKALKDTTGNDSAKAETHPGTAAMVVPRARSRQKKKPEPQRRGGRRDRQ